MLAIRNFGIYWKRAHINFGKRGVLGNLKGIKRKNKKVVKDFRYQSGIYVLYDKDLNPLYIGQAGSGDKKLFHRLKAHRKGHLRNRWEYFSWFGLRAVNKSKTKDLSDKHQSNTILRGKLRDALDEIEAVLIQVLEPKLNKQGSKWRGAEEYLQFIPEEDEYYTLEDIFEKQKEIEKLVLKIGK